nr:hypothetical protein [uncultured Allomuricauda sp.]
MKILGIDKVLSFSFLYGFISTVLLACDPSESIETVFENQSSQNIKISFVSHTLLKNLSNNTEFLDVGLENEETYQRFTYVTDIGKVFLTFQEFDSIYITNTSNQVLKIFKPDTPGKNIYNVDQYWTVRETGKNHFEYTYTITDEDIGN